MPPGDEGMTPPRLITTITNSPANHGTPSPNARMMQYIDTPDRLQMTTDHASVTSTRPLRIERRTPADSDMSISATNAASLSEITARTRRASGAVSAANQIAPTTVTAVTATIIKPARIIGGNATN